MHVRRCLRLHPVRFERFADVLRMASDVVSKDLQRAHDEVRMPSSRPQGSEGEKKRQTELRSPAGSELERLSDCSGKFAECPYCELFEVPPTSRRRRWQEGVMMFAVKRGVFSLGPSPAGAH
jgi:hypothetical protein